MTTLSEDGSPNQILIEKVKQLFKVIEKGAEKVLIDTLYCIKTSLEVVILFYNNYVNVVTFIFS